jgi:seryl-tRNA synthetase
MLDLKFIRQEADHVRTQLSRLQSDPTLVDRIIDLDEQRRRLRHQSEQQQSRLNAVSKEIGKRKRTGEDTTEAEDEARELRENIRTAEAETAPLDEQVRDLMLQVPNLPDAEVPDGASENDNVILREEGVRREFDFEPKPHWDLGQDLDIIDFERGVKVAGSRFYILKGDGARLQRALISFMLDLHSRDHGYTEVYPPYMVLPECAVGTGQLPKFADTMYQDRLEDFYFIPTAEVPVTNMYREEILPDDALPINHVAYTACFRREAMSAGRDVRGIKRGHQFDKVEMVKFVRPDESGDELLRLLEHAENVARALELPYRVIEMCAGDLSFTAARKFDLELWAPGQDEWLEVSSCSNFKDFQARRANIRFRPSGGKPEFVHTLNGSGLALPRTLIAVMESYQRADGSVDIPPVLQPYMGGQQRIEPRGDI